MRNQPQLQRVILYLSKEISERQTGLKCITKRQLFHTSRHLRGSCHLSGFIQESVKELCCSKSIVSFQRFLSLCTTTSFTDFSLCMDFYVVISILGLPEAATSRFLFHMAILSACSYQKDENGKGKFEEETTQTIPCRRKALLSQIWLESPTTTLPLFLLGQGKQLFMF